MKTFIWNMNLWIYTASLTIANNTPPLHVCTLIFTSIFCCHFRWCIGWGSTCTSLNLHRFHPTTASSRMLPWLQSDTPFVTWLAQDCTQLHCLNTLLDLHWIGSDILHTIKYNLCTTIYNIVYRHASRQTCTIVLTIYSNFHTS